MAWLSGPAELRVVSPILYQSWRGKEDFASTDFSAHGVIFPIGGYTPQCNANKTLNHITLIKPVCIDAKQFATSDIPQSEAMDSPPTD